MWIALKMGSFIFLCKAWHLFWSQEYRSTVHISAHPKEYCFQETTTSMTLHGYFSHKKNLCARVDIILTGSGSPYLQDSQNHILKHKR